MAGSVTTHVEPDHPCNAGGSDRKTSPVRVPLGPLVYFAALFTWGIVDFVISEPIEVGYQILTLAYLAAMATMYLLPGRSAPRATGRPWEWLVALASANLLIPLSLMPPRPLVPYLALMVGLVAANLFSWWALLTLRSSFSLTPEARRLVTSGPYRFVRHPLYLAGFVIGTVLLLATWSIASLFLFALYATATLLRARAEDRVLERAFPGEYARYRGVTPAFLPRIRP